MTAIHNSDQIKLLRMTESLTLMGCLSLFCAIIKKMRHLCQRGQFSRQVSALVYIQYLISPQTGALQVRLQQQLELLWFRHAKECAVFNPFWLLYLFLSSLLVGFCLYTWK